MTRKNLTEPWIPFGAGTVSRTAVRKVWTVLRDAKPTHVNRQTRTVQAETSLLDESRCCTQRPSSELGLVLSQPIYGAIAARASTSNG
jgi:hypothetical protein